MPELKHCGSKQRGYRPIVFFSVAKQSWRNSTAVERRKRTRRGIPGLLADRLPSRTRKVAKRFRETTATSKPLTLCCLFIGNKELNHLEERLWGVHIFQATIHFCQCRIVAVVEHQDWGFRALCLQRFTQSNSARFRNRVAHQDQIHEWEPLCGQKVRNIGIISQRYDRISRSVQECSSSGLQRSIPANRYN